MRHARARRSEIDGILRGPGRAAVLALLSLVTTSPARADITPLSSQLTASSAADVEPLDAGNVPDADSDGTPDGQLKGLSVSTFQSDSTPPDLSEAVTTHASVVYTGDDLLTVNMFGARSGTDDTLGEPGGSYASRTGFDLSFQNLAVGSITVDWVLTFDRPNTGTFTPFGIVVRRGGIIDSRGPSVPFDAMSGMASGSETFDLNETNLAFYDLELELYMVGSTSNVADPESWDATFTVHTPPMTIVPVPEPSAPFATVVGWAVLGLLRRFRRA